MPAAALASQLRVTARAIEEAVAELDALDGDEAQALLATAWDSLAALIDPATPRPFSRFLDADLEASIGG